MVTQMDGSGMAEFDREAAGFVVRVASMAAGLEAMKPRPVSRVRTPSGAAQGETLAEHDSRIVKTAVMHLLEQGLVVLPENIGELLDDFIPAERVGHD
jgi:hypothetical protein